jgi:ATP-dependent 26S proteasome regulatory subunit
VRPGRLELHLCLDLPTFSDRLAILRLGVRGACEGGGLALSPGVDLEELAAKAEGLSNSQLRALPVEAALLAEASDCATLSQEHLLLALKAL